ncbi:MAG: hypothetical protein AB1716_09135 [Planctomycetota bacterium]
MREAFLRYLLAVGLLPPNRIDRLREALRAAPEPVGAIAYRYGMIAGFDIDAILDEQRHQRRPFGEIAIDKGLLTQAQVDTLLAVQRLRAATEVAEALALAGLVPVEELVQHLGHFLSERAPLATVP